MLIDALISPMTADGPAPKRPPHNLFAIESLVFPGSVLSDAAGADEGDDMRAFRTGLVLAVVLGLPACSKGDTPAPFKVQDFAKGGLAKLEASAPNRTAPTIPFESRGAKVMPADFKGRVLVLNLWATWCAPCIKELPALDRLQGAFKTTDLVVVAVSQDKDGWAAVDKLWPKLKLKNIDSYLDENGTYIDNFRTPGLPLTVIYDRQGREIARMMRPVAWDGPEAKAFLLAVASK
jgi:thiol-disulfide isomerase/thioredoxin